MSEVNPQKTERRAYRKAPKVPGGSWPSAMRLLTFLLYAPPNEWFGRVQGPDGVYAEIRSLRKLSDRVGADYSRVRRVIEWLETQQLVLGLDRRSDLRWLVKLRPVEPAAALKEP